MGQCLFEYLKKTRSILISSAHTQRVCDRRMRAQPPAGFQGDARGGKLEGRSSPDFPSILRSVAMQESRLKRFGYSFSEAVICVLVNLIFEHFDFIHGFRVLDHVIAQLNHSFSYFIFPMWDNMYNLIPLFNCTPLPKINFSVIFFNFMVSSSIWGAKVLPIVIWVHTMATSLSHRQTTKLKSDKNNRTDGECTLHKFYLSNKLKGAHAKTIVPN